MVMGKIHTFCLFSDIFMSVPRLATNWQGDLRKVTSPFWLKFPHL